MADQNWNIVSPGFRPVRWFTLPAVYSDALSYGDEIAKIAWVLSKLCENNNILPDYIQQLIKEYINGGEIGEIVNTIISQYILNPKYPPNNLTPAVGDGSADDTEAVQGCIDYVHNAGGGAIYFPSGAYLVQPLTLYDNVCLIGFGRYASRLVLKGGATSALLNGNNISGIQVMGMTLDGNSAVQVNDVNVLDITGGDIIINDSVVKDGYTLAHVAGTSGVLQFDGVAFGGAVNYALDLSGNIGVTVSGCVFQSLSAVSGVSVIRTACNNGNYDFVCLATCPVCVTVSGNDNSFHFSASSATSAYQDTGEGNQFNVNGRIYYGKFDDTFRIDTKNVLVNATDITENVTDKTTTATGAISESGASYTGEYTGEVAISAETKSESYTGAVEEHALSKDTVITNTDSLEANDQTVTLTGDHKISGVNSTETWSGNKSMTAEDVEESVDKKTIEFKENFFNLQFTNKDVNLYYANYDYVNVKDYGAVGDGVTDDSVAFNAATATGKNIYIPSGSYNVPNWSLVQSSANILSQGTIVNALTINTFKGSIEGGTWTTLAMGGNSQNVTIRNATFQSTTGHGLYVNGCRNLTIENCRITGQGYTLQLVQCNFAKILNCWVTMNSTETEESHTIQLYNCEYGIIQNCLAENGVWFNYSVYNSDYCQVLGCISRNSIHEGINLENTNNSIVANCYVSFDGTTSNDYGICIFGNGGNYANLNVISGCVVANSAQSGIAIDGNAHSNIAQNNILGNVNTKNVIRLYAMSCTQLNGYDGRPSNNYFLNNMIIKGQYTAGFYEEINPLGVNIVSGNGCDQFLPAGNYTTANFNNNFPSGTHPVTLTTSTTGAEITESFIQYVGANWAFVQFNLNMTSTGSVTINLPITGSSIGLVLDLSGTGITYGLITNNTITIANAPSGQSFVRAFMHFRGITVG